MSTIRNNKTIRSFRALILISILAGTITACKKNNPDPNNDPIPNVGVNEYLNLQLPSNIALANPGAWMLIEGGVKGIFIHHTYDDTYVAFDRNCSYRPGDACSQVTPDSTGFFLYCGSKNGSTWTPCCGSKFQFDGIISQGPAIYPLKRYTTSLDGSMLHIYN